MPKAVQKKITEAKPVAKAARKPTATKVASKKTEYRNLLFPGRACGLKSAPKKRTK